ncbi:DNA-binding domain-containing protein [Legionella cardiaca]|uniref:DNA-binding domain-containing protein n=1 Tax=Legionella cardiaca TaxID=1071983 RepID=A0ABY8ATQ9_9GAMM|nr:DNA-binding domain-containing protein [Legionella cardiaca]WED43586.1 DNA-binding domain-containing protein [Legionella cardiaca]
MNKLLDLQEQFQNYLLNGQSNIKQGIVDSEKIPATLRLNIYLDAYRTRLLECLANNYPVFKNYVGSESFYEMGNDYLEKNPSSYRSIRWFGDNFSHYLKTQEKHALAELAEFEWGLTLAFDAADAPVLTIEEMAAISPDCWANMTFTPHPSLQQVHFYWNIVPIWQAVANEQQPENLIENTKSVSWVIWRSNYLSRFYSLTEDEAWAINAMLQGASFGEICAGLCEWFSEEEVGLQAASLLKSWIQSGLIAKIKL